MQWCPIIPVVHDMCQSIGSVRTAPSHMVNHHTGPSEGQESPGGFSNWWLSHLFLEWEKSFLVQPCMGTLVIFMLAWWVFTSVCRNKMTKSNKVKGARKVWRKVRKSKGQWLQLTVSLDWCDSTHWSPSAPLPRPASLPSPSKPRTTHRNLQKQKVHPQVPMVELYNSTLEQDNIPHGQVCSMMFLTLFSTWDILRWE